MLVWPLATPVRFTSRFKEARFPGNKSEQSSFLRFEALPVVAQHRNLAMSAIALMSKHKRTHLRKRKTDVIAESARGISTRAAHRSGLDTLASSGSSHCTEAAAFH
jgi:hypothetical protein